MSKEDELKESYQLGISEGLKDASVYLMDIAKKKFGLFQDNAEEIRLYAKELMKKSEKSHPGVPE